MAKQADGAGMKRFLYMLALFFVFVGVTEWVVSVASRQSTSESDRPDVMLGVRVLLEFLIAAVCLGSGAVVEALEQWPSDLRPPAMPKLEQWPSALRRPAVPKTGIPEAPLAPPSGETFS
jgi:hypothetical protein